MLLYRTLISVLLDSELGRWSARGKAPVFWWRDDDARRPGPALNRLLRLSERFEAPLTLAVVPDGDIAALVAACATTPDVELAIHGFRHENRAPEGLPSGEVHDGDSLDEVTAELTAAIAAFAQAGLKPELFVPPWNNAHPTLNAALAHHGLAVSRYGQARAPEASPPRVDAHLDLMRWKPTARFRGGVRVLLRARRLLAERRLGGQWDQPIGLLTHHLDHDEPTWTFLEAFLSRITPVSRRGF
ncbi:MAG: DUF2334 domain-containing protein [Alphaproteobacteria bacterium]|nr:DUF2334 domain-containing protein [Alphaproteobacteria bacterium]